MGQVIASIRPAVTAAAETTPGTRRDPRPAATSARARYHRLLASGVGAAPDSVDGADGAADPAPSSVDEVWDTLVQLRTAEQGAPSDPTGPAVPAVPAVPTGPAVATERILLGYAPTALLDGCWLAAAVHVRCAHSPLGAALIDAFYLESGEGDAGRHHGNLYRGLLAAAGLSLPEATSAALAEDPRLDEADFELALPGLELARPLGVPALSEIVGFHAAATVLGPPPCVRRAAGVRPGLFLTAHDAGSPQGQRAELLARRCLAAWAESGGADWHALWRGASRLIRRRQAWLTSLRPAAERSPWQAMIELVQAKARHGFGYHRQLALGGRRFDEWFDTRGSQRPDARGFLRELARSRWVVPGQPERSPLVQRAVAFGGPMFGVFTEDELAVMRAWITALGSPDPSQREDAPAAQIPTSPTIQTAPPQDVPPVPARSAARLPPLPLLYHRLLSRGGEPATAALAREHVERTLVRAARAVTPARLRAQGLWPYSAPRLQGWVEARLLEQLFDGKNPEELDAVPDTTGLVPELVHQDVVFLLLQLAPAALVDGAWLHGAASPASFHTPVSSLLFRIYRDELGAGVACQHHGNVLRRALAAQGVDLPPCDSAEFAAWPGLLPAAFSTPVLWLAVALHGDAFLPELLGLNLAIEMAGVGRTYERAIHLLRRHGIDAYFFELHNTIDNGATGHTAWSAQAIRLYFDEQLPRGDAAAREQAWLRLWRGHAAYALSSGPLLRAVALRLGPRLGWRWLRRQLVGGPPAQPAARG
jgi:hypothetical protein